MALVDLEQLSRVRMCDIYVCILTLFPFILIYKIYREFRLQDKSIIV